MRKKTTRLLGTALGALAAACGLTAPAHAMEVGQDSPNDVNRRVVLHVYADELAMVQRDWRNSGPICSGALMNAPDFDWKADTASSRLQRCSDEVQVAALYATQANVTGGIYVVFVNYPGPLGWAVWDDSYTTISPY